MPLPSFAGLRVLTLESRRAAEISTLVTTFGGTPLSVPALREVPLESNTQAAAFVRDFTRNQFDLLIALTGVGLKALLAVVETLGNREAFLAALRRTRIAARGPKPVAVLRDLQITPWVTAPEPNTWRELLAALDDAQDARLPGARVAVQQYGRSNPELLEGLRQRGAVVTPVPVYQYALPQDLGPLRSAVKETTSGKVDVVLFTTATQVEHFFHVASELGVEAELGHSLANVVVASIGPTTGEALAEHGLYADIEASHPKMGILVREAAEHSAAMRNRKSQERT